MRKVSLFISMSLDGYIADRKGGVDWLGGQDAEAETPDTWVYEDFTTYVITHKANTSSENIRFSGENPVELVKKLREETGKGIWICGGANLAGQLIREDLIDCYYITVIPTLLGDGIRLFGKEKTGIDLRLTHTRAYNGMVELVYVRR